MIHMGDIMRTLGDFQYIGRISRFMWEDVMNTLGGYHNSHGGISREHRGIFSTLEGYHYSFGGYHEYIGGCTVHWDFQYKLKALPHKS